ncbi:hypothetical protein SKAU_G00242470 [Synaphobranchus kaupii]|uniref:Uncharacterized protein n=1 Tax=Synaphobranchus kaupii TaxID=118154 RepID=A0A9Q1F7S1_SYNKA|nr:hypothetical protein SKAU_G00242470 [Synaphobranchus kaupii]
MWGRSLYQFKRMCLRPVTPLRGPIITPIIAPALPSRCCFGACLESAFTRRRALVRRHRLNAKPTERHEIGAVQRM